MRQLLYAFIFLFSLSIISCSDVSTGPDPINRNGSSNGNGNNNHKETTTYTVTVDVTPTGAGTTSPAKDSYEEGEKIELKASSTDKYVFKKWSGDIESSANPYSLTVDQDYNITAHFERKSYDLTVKTKGNGTVDQKVIPTSGARGYESGTVVKLTAKPDSGWTFVEWGGDNLSSTDNPVRITVKEPKTITAVFEKKSFGLTIKTNGNGSVKKDPNQKRYDYNTSVKLTASPDKGWEFVNWKGDLSGSKNSKTITIDKAKTVTAVFQKKKYDLIVKVEGHGTVDQKIISTSGMKGNDSGTVIKLTAKPDKGWTFIKWKGGINSAENPKRITIDKPKTITAVFEKKSFGLAIKIDGNGSVKKDPNQNKYDYNTSVKLMAKPDKGWEFVNWQGDLSGNKNPDKITVNGEKNVTAVFAKKTSKIEKSTYTIGTSVKGNGTIKIIPKKNKYTYNEKIKFKAIADNGYVFIKWKDFLSGSENPISINITKDIKVSALFKKPADALVSHFYAVIIGGKVCEAYAILRNELPKPILLKKIIIKDAKGNIKSDHDIDEGEIKPGKSLDFDLVYGIPTSIDKFKKMTLTWKCEYGNEAVDKKVKARIPDYPSNAKVENPDKVIRLIIHNRE